GYRTNAAFALDSFDHHGAHIVGKLLFEIFHVIEFHEVEARNERLELLAILLLSCRRQRSERPSMKRLIERQNSKLGPAERAGELQASFDRFRSTVGEERAIEAGNLAEFLREPSLILVIDQVRHVQRPLDLFSKNLHDAWMVVTQRVDGDSSEQVQISFVRFIDKVGATAPVHQKL